MANPEHVALLKQNVEKWNEWRWDNKREDKPNLNALVVAALGWPALRKADLSEVDFFAASLRRANLRGANLSRADLRKADLRGANLRTDLPSPPGVTISPIPPAYGYGPNLDGANLQNADLSGAKLQSADLSGADLRDTDLRGANLSGVDFRDADLHGADFFKVGPNGVDLSEADLRGVEISDAILRGANLREANLSDAILRGANLSGASLRGANLSGAELSRADLSGTDLREANLSRANLWETNFGGADLNEVTLAWTSFGSIDLRRVKGLESVRHAGPSQIGIDTIYRSNGEIPEMFLRGSGVPESFIVQMKALVSAMQPIQFYSCFISYSMKDQDFADRLYADLQGKGIRCWFAPHDIVAGKKVHEQIDEAIRVYDRLVLILSSESMASEWVKTEIAKARKREVKEKLRVLFPLRLVEFETLRDWECFDSDTGKDSAREIREYFIPDFSRWKEHEKSHRLAPLA
jgi:uncharacterized protein YjbI with pentapeptide repeats